MVLEARIHASAMASCSSKMLTPCRASITTSEPPCNLYTHSTTKDLHGHCRIVASKAFHREPVCTIAPLPKQKPLINQINVDSYQKSSFSEHWIEGSIYEIVKHINEAPFLQLLFDSKDDSTIITAQRQRVPVGNSTNADEKWKEMKSSVNRASPDGVILVHHLQGNSIEVEDELGMQTTQRDAKDNGIDNRSDGKDLWGILVLGKKIAKSACYILETTSVASPFGTCRSFCLTKAQGFGPSWHDQIQSSWLLKTDI